MYDVEYFQSERNHLLRHTQKAELFDIFLSGEYFAKTSVFL